MRFRLITGSLALLFAILAHAQTAPGDSALAPENAAATSAHGQSTHATNACAASPASRPSIAEDEAAIAAFNKRYLKAINDGDSATLASLTTPGHIMIAPGRPPIVGKEANDAANARVAQMFKIEETWTPLETVIACDLAYQRGTFTVAATAKSGGTTRNTRGNFLRIYRRQPDGEWRMVRDMFNSDQPAALN